MLAISVAKICHDDLQVQFCNGSSHIFLCTQYSCVLKPQTPLKSHMVREYLNSFFSGVIPCKKSFKNC